jgi:hypothetical protein
LISSELSSVLSLSYSSRTLVAGGASIKLGLGGLLAEDCHCCNQWVLILQLALVKMVAEHLGLSSGTHCWAQES